MSLFNFVDFSGPPVPASYLNALDLLRNSLVGVAGGALTLGPILANGTPGPTALTINQNGSIVMAAPVGATTLTINGTAGGSSVLNITDGAETFEVIYDASHNASVGLLGAHNLNFLVGGVTRLQITSTGGVALNSATDPGVGNINVTGGLQVAGLLPGAANSTGATFSTVETYVTPAYNIPGNALAVGQAFEIRVHGTCTSTVANNVTFNLRVGANGTTADTAVATLAVGAATSGTNLGWTLKVYLVVHAIGASATFSFMNELANAGNTTGINTVSLAASTGISTAFNSTGTLKMGVSMVTAAATTTVAINNTEIVRLF